MDPVSIAASAVTLAALLRKSYKVGHSFCQGVSRTPEEAQRGIAILEGLQHYLQSIHTACDGDAGRLDSVPGLGQLLASYGNELQTVTDSVRKAQESLAGGKRRHRLRARVSWAALAADRLERFLDRFKQCEGLFQHAIRTLKERDPPPQITTINISSATVIHCLEGSPNSLGISLSKQDPQQTPIVSRKMLVPINEDALSDAWKEQYGLVRPWDNETISPIPDQSECSHDLARRWTAPTSSQQLRVRAINVFTSQFLVMRYCYGPFFSAQLTEGTSDNVESVVTRPGYACELSIRLLNGRLGQINWRIVGDHVGGIYRRYSLRHELSFQSTVPYDAEIFDLARMERVDLLRALVRKRKGSYSDVGPDGCSLLHIAAGKGSAEFVKHLLDEGVDVNAVDDEGETPLHVALAASSNYNVPRLLIDYGADLEARRIDGSTPAHTFSTDVSREVIRKFHEDIDLSCKNDCGMTPMHYLSWSSKTEPGQIEPLLACGEYPLKQKDGRGRTALHYAAQRGNIDLLEFYLSLHAVSATDADKEGKTVMHLAVESRRAGAIDVLSRHGANVLARDSSGNTSLHLAARRGNLAAVKRLVEVGGSAALHWKNACGRTPLESAVASSRAEVTAYLQTVMGVPKAPTCPAQPVPPKDLVSGEIADASWPSRCPERLLTKGHFSVAVILFLLSLFVVLSKAHGAERLMLQHQSSIYTV